MAPDDAPVLRATAGPERTLNSRDLAALRAAGERPRPRPSRPRREPADRSLTYFCSDPQCEHATWSPHEQAVHMAREFRRVVNALAQAAPGSPEALRLTGGVVLADLTDDECRDGAAAYQRARRAQAGGMRGRAVEQITVATYLRYMEYWRRSHRGTLRPAGPRAARAPRERCAKCGAPWTPENTYAGSDGITRCLPCRRRADAAAHRRRRRAQAGSPMAIREWARAQGLDVPEHGPVPGRIRQAWEAARLARENASGNGVNGRCG